VHKLEPVLETVKFIYRVAQNKPDYLLLLSKFCISPTKHVSRCAELIEVIFPFHVKFLLATYLSLVDLLDCKLFHQWRQCCLTYEQTEVDCCPFFRHRSVNLLIKSFKQSTEFPLSQRKFFHHSKRSTIPFQLATYELVLYRHLLTHAFSYLRLVHR